jgi:hypothetical protein
VARAQWQRYVRFRRHVLSQLDRMEAVMVDVDQALTDLAAAVQSNAQAIADAIGRMNEDVVELQRQIAAGDPAKLQAAADAIEARVADLGAAAAVLANIDPVKPVPPPPPPEPTPEPTE